MPAAAIAIVWFRQDLRLADNPALHVAVTRGYAVLPLYIFSPQQDGEWAIASAARVWLHHSLTVLSAALKKRGAPLIIRSGDPLAGLEKLLAETGAEAVFWNRRYEPDAIQIDRRIKATLRERGFTVESFKANVLFEHQEIKNQGGAPFKVFTPFSRQLLTQLEVQNPFPAPQKIHAPKPLPASDPLAGLALLPKINWHAGFSAHWQMGEAGAQAQLKKFLRAAVDAYPEQRDFPAAAGVSRLSPHLHFGEISPRQLIAALHARAQSHGRISLSAAELAYQRQILWREFAHHLLLHFPHTPNQPLRPDYAAFPWAGTDAQLRAWQRGLTGYPIVDAGMRELWHSGWMHNRVRMIVGSFLVKDLLIHWLQGARWFWDTLVDADLANNTLGWQWVAGCGADAAPYFRIFNPLTQAQRFDANGAYIRRWVPELGRLPDEHIHAPQLAGAAVLQQAGVKLDKDYPAPVVDHAAVRARALQAFASLRQS